MIGRLTPPLFPTTGEPSATSFWSLRPLCLNRTTRRPAAVRRPLKTNIYTRFWIIQGGLAAPEARTCIIGTTSEQAYDPDPDLYGYAHTKAATMSYVKSLDKQLGPKGIRVNGVSPGPIWSSLQVSGAAP